MSNSKPPHSPIALGSPEFKALKALWDQKLADSGFTDLEAPPPCRDPDDPSLVARHRAYYRDHLRPDNPANARHVPLDALLASESGDQPPFLKAATERLWTGPFDGIAEALQRFTFKNAKDKKIAQALYDGETWESITARLHVGRDRITRVKRDIKAWLRRDPPSPRYLGPRF